MMAGFRQGIAWVLAVAAIVACACSREDDADRQAARQAFADLVSALDRGDGPALWSFADDATQRYFDELSTEIRNAAELIDRTYPAADRVAARAGIGADWIGRGASGQGLFLALLDPRRLGAPSDAEAREVGRVDIDGGIAVVIARSGETVRFERDAGGRYRTGLFLDLFRSRPTTSTWKENLETVRRNAAVLGESSPPHPAP